MNERLSWRPLAAMALACTAAASVQAQPAETNEAAATAASRYCVTELQPLAAGEQVSASRQVGCFDTFSAAIAAATNNAVTLADDVTPETITEADMAPAAATLIGIDYDGRYYRGTNKMVWSANNSFGCYGGRSYVANMPLSFNNRLTSTRAFSGCTRNTSYDGYYQRGDWVRCFPNCTYVTSFMDNRASSKRWAR